MCENINDDSNKNFGRLSISDKPILYETSLTTVADIAGKMALLAGGLYLTQRWKNNMGESEVLEKLDEVKDESKQSDVDFTSDVDRILKVITKLKYGQEFENHEGRRDYNEFVDRSVCKIENSQHLPSNYQVEVCVFTALHEENIAKNIETTSQEAAQALPFSKDFEEIHIKRPDDIVICICTATEHWTISI